MSFKPKRASVVYYVSDIRRTEKFYNDTFNLPEVTGAQPGTGVATGHSGGHR